MPHASVVAIELHKVAIMGLACCSFREGDESVDSTPCPSLADSTDCASNAESHTQQDNSAAPTPAGYIPIAMHSDGVPPSPPTHLHFCFWCAPPCNTWIYIPGPTASWRAAHLEVDSSSGSSEGESEVLSSTTYETGTEHFTDAPSDASEQ